ncbi:hypothetical protein REPUB_Repub06bG0188200 [Reevesia pubescens]
MNDLSSDMQETQVIDYTSWFNNNFGITGTSEETASSFDMCHLHPDSPPQDTAYQVQQERRFKYDGRYWLSEYDSCCDSYWGDDLFSGRYSTNDGCNDPVLETEDPQQSEDQDQSYASYCEDNIRQPDCDYNPWSYHQYCEDDDSYSYNGEEPRTTYGYRMDEVGLCECIFGYFPCMLQEQKEYNNLQ